MKISKTQFVNFARCDRFSALNEIHKNKDRAVIALTDDPELDDLISIESEKYKADLLSNMYDEEDEDLLEITDQQMETMMPYFLEIEQMVGRILDKKYQGTIIYNTETYKQKRFSFEEDGFHFYCFLDGYQEDESKIRIFETKATTSRKFLDVTYKNDEDEKKSIFSYSPEGILILDETFAEVNEYYYKSKQKLFKKYESTGLSYYIYDIGYQAFVLQNAVKTTKKVEYYLAVLNTEYIHDGKTDEKGKPIYPDNIIQFVDVTPLVEDVIKIIKNDKIDVIRRLNTMNASEVKLGVHCQRKKTRQCMFYPICYNKLDSKDNPFIYRSPRTAYIDDDGEKLDNFDLLNQGIFKATDVPTHWLNRKDREIQKEVLLTNKLYAHPKKIKDGINQLRYPIYHLDFETFPCPLPRFKGEKPYSQSPFQFSIHIEKEPGVCDQDNDNHYFLAGTHEDLREDLVKKLVDVIKLDGGTVLAYNQGFEKGVIKKLVENFPAYSKQLIDISERLFDLMNILRGNKDLYKGLGYSEEEYSQFNYYHKDLAGSYSIKKILPLFTNLSYQKLVVSNGVGALTTYAKFPEMEKSKFKEMYQHLIDYCKLDTWAMVKILDGLR